MIIVTWGTHFDVIKTLEALNKPSNFFVVNEDKGFTEYDMERISEGKIPLIFVDESFSVKRKDKLEEIVAQARDMDVDLVIETVYPKALEVAASFADFLSINNVLFSRIR